MPKLGLTMTEGTLAAWHVRPGDRVQSGDVLFVVETEKTATDVAATESGQIGALLMPQGSIVPVGTAVATWASDGAARINATPLARRLARRNGIDLGTIRGSGPARRIKARDVEQALVEPAPLPPSRPAARAPLMGNAVARRMIEAKQTIPHFYLAAEADATRLLELRKDLNHASGKPRISLTHLLLAAAGRAMLSHPELGAVWSEAGPCAVGGSDIGVAIDTPNGLVAPVLRDAGSLRLDELALAADALIETARAGRLAPGDMDGGVLTVSNLGMHRITFVVPIINPGQAAILGVGAPRPVFRPDAHGAPVLRQEMTLVLSADHRVLDGVRASRLLMAIVDLLERPANLLRG